MKKWYEIQFTIIIVINVLAMVFTFAGEVLSKSNFLYKTETFTITISLLILSGMICILGDIYSENNKK